MTSPAKQLPAKKGGMWGSFLSDAVSGLESRLDTILADDSEASAKARAAEEASKSKTKPRAGSGNLAPPTAVANGSREASRTRANDRLAERLAKATAAKTGTGSAVPSRVGSPAIGESTRASEEEARASGHVVRSVPEVEKTTDDSTSTQQPDTVAATNEVAGDEKSAVEKPTLLSSRLPINPARMSVDSSRPSIDVSRSGDVSSRPSSDLPNGTAQTFITESKTDADEDQMRAERQRQEEMHIYLEKIDALQSKLQYLARETVAAAKEANASTSTASEEKRLAEKDEKIALLMEEGEKLSKTELRHLQTIKKLRVKGTEDEKTTADVRKRLEKAEKMETDLKTKLRRAEVEARQAGEKSKQIAVIETQVEELRIDRENAAELVKSLTVQLKEAKDKLARAEKEASEVDKGRIAALENEVEDAQIEKKLAQDRAQSELKKVREENAQQVQRFDVRELELKNEIVALEGRMEAMRSRAEEEATSGVSTGGEGSVVLLRQVEMLQSQYQLARENWGVIEGSLNARVGALEAERDDWVKREGEARKRAKDVVTKARGTEVEFEREAEARKGLEQELYEHREEVKALRSTLEANRVKLEDAQVEFERQKNVWEAEAQQRIEGEKSKWMKNSQHPPPPGSNTRKTSAGADIHASRRPGTGNARLTPHDLAALHIVDPSRPNSSRRASRAPRTQTFSASPREGSPILSRQESIISLDAHHTDTATPSIEGPTAPSFPESPEDEQRTINDLLSTSTAHHPTSGPSVQLVERLSALVRRLESEKSASKDETARLTSQRDSARDEVVGLMREVESKRTGEAEVATLRQEMTTLKERYEGALLLAGEREEECVELRADVGELKRLYRELVEGKMPGMK